MKRSNTIICFIVFIKQLCENLFLIKKNFCSTPESFVSDNVIKQLFRTWWIPAWIPSSSFWSPASSEIAPGPWFPDAAAAAAAACSLLLIIIIWRWLSWADGADGGTHVAPAAPAKWEFSSGKVAMLIGGIEWWGSMSCSQMANYFMKIMLIVSVLRNNKCRTYSRA